MAPVLVRVVMTLTVLVSALPVRAQPAQDLSAWFGRTVTAVTVELEGRLDESSTLRELIEVRAGDPLSPTAVRESLAHLFNLGRFEDVSVLGFADGVGIRVVFALTPLHPIDRIELRGNLGLDRRALERAALEPSGGRARAARPDVARDAVVRTLIDEGFSRPVVTTALEATHEVHRSTLVLTVEAGARQRIGTVDVKGDATLAPGSLTTEVGLIAGAAYRRRATEDALRQIGEELRSRGYYEASVTHFTTPAGDDVVNVTVTVDRGPQVEIVVTGDPLPPGGQDEWIPIRRENSADQDLLEDSAFRIRQAWQREGYWLAAVEPQRRESPDGTRMVVTFTIARGPRFRLAAIEIEGESYFSDNDIRSQMNLRVGEWYVRERVDVAVAMLLRAYRFAGFNASIKVSEVRLDGDEGRVGLRFAIVEGPLRVVSSVVLNGVAQVPEADVRRVVRSQPNQPLRDAQVREDQRAIEQLYLDRGYQTVTVDARYSAEAPFVVTYTVIEGIQTLVDHIIVVGNSRVSTDTILDEVTLQPGQPFGQAARLESQRNLAELATFRRISITEASEGRAEGHVDVVVQVEEAPATTIGYGGGLEFGRRARQVVGGGVEDALWFAPRGFVEVGRRNLFGTNRSASLFSRLSLGPRSEPADPARDGRGLTLSEYRVTGSYRAPGTLGGAVDTVFSATVEREIRTTFTFVRRSANAEAIHQPSPRVSVFGRYALDSTELFDTRIPEEDQPLIDRRFPQIRLSTVSGGVVWDRRDDVLDPTAGGLMSVETELAVRALGSEVGFIKAFAQAYGFRRVTRRNRVILAGRAQIGLARGFAREVVVVMDAQGRPVVDEAGQTVTEVVADLPAGRRFFTGGSASVRGFQQDRIGVPNVINEDGLSNGGNGLLVFNGEVRTQIWTDVSVVAFVDGGNVFRRAADLSIRELRGSVGAGVRYRSPLGPLRLDVGFKLDRRFVAGARERGWEFHLSIGEVF